LHNLETGGSRVNKRLRYAISAAAAFTGVVLTGVVLTTTPVQAKPEYAKKEKTGCTTCHVSIKSKELNPTGKCYGEKKSMTECKKE
jgi:hypothetical protein